MTVRSSFRTRFATPNRRAHLMTGNLFANVTDSVPILTVVAIVSAAVTALAAFGITLWRSRNLATSTTLPLAELEHAQREAAARLEAMITMLADRQSQVQHAVNERLDSVSHRLGDSLQKTTQHTTDNLQKLHERLAVIDSAQKNITALASEVTSLQGVLANKQSRGAFGQLRMESIIQDNLPKGAYHFQHTLSNRTRPDCCVFLPDKRPMAIDAKFPLEAVTAYRDAKSDEERKGAAQRLRTDVGRHVTDIAYKYLIPGETYEVALMFIPSESLYAELYDGFDDLFQRAYRARVVIVSPSLLTLAIQMVQQIQKDARMREAADQIRDEVARLVRDVSLLRERIHKLQNHFNQASEDIRLAVVSIGKIETHGERIQQVELQAEAAHAMSAPAAPTLKLQAGE